MKSRLTSITERMILYYVLLSISALTVVGSLFWYAGSDALLSRTFDQMTSVKFAKKKQVENYFADRIYDINQLANQPVIINNGILSKSSRYYSDNKSLTGFLQSYISGNRYFTSAYVVNINSGKTIEILKGNSIENDSINIREDVLKSINSGNQIFESIFTDQNDGSKEPQLYFVASITSSNNAGLCILRSSFDEINKIMLENSSANGLGESGESYLVSNDYKMKSQSRFLNKSVNNIKVETEGVIKALKGIPGTSIIEDYRGIEVLSSWDKLNVEGINWVVLSEIDAKEAEVPIVNLRNLLLIIIVFASIVTFILTYYISKRITNPVVSLTKAAENLGKGEESYICDIKTGDEIEILAKTFNDMAALLKKKEAEIIDERKSRLKSIINAQEKERERLSRELHDGLGQSMIALRMKLEIAEPESADDDTFEDVKSDIDKIIEEIRRISNNLMPSVLQEFGLVAAINNLCDNLNSIGEKVIKTDININNRVLTDEAKIYLFRITQEALSNCFKHSKANSIKLIMNNDNENLYYIIEDDGCGFDYCRGGIMKGNGIYHMKERINLLNGDIEFCSLRGSGSRIEIRIPVGEKL